MKMLLIRNFGWLTKLILLLLIIPTIVLFVLSMLNTGNAFAIIVVEAFLGFGAINGLKSALMRKTLNILYQECDPEKFLTQVNEFIDGEREKRMKLNFLNWKLIALMQCKRLDEALEIQKLMESKFDERLPVSLKATFSISFATLSIARKELSLAEEWMKKAELLMKEKNFGPLEIKRITFALNLNRCEIDLMLGRTEGCEEKLKNILEFEVRKSVLVRAHYLLGKLYFNINHPEGVKMEVQFVLENGNKLPEVELAREMIKDE